LPAQFTRRVKLTAPEAEVSPIRSLLEVTRALEAVGAECFVAGSFASTIYGMVRSTADADVVARLEGASVVALDRKLPDFYMDPVAALEAVRSRKSFNVIDKRNMFKVAIFIPDEGDPFEASQMQRRRRMQIGPVPGDEAAVATAEDTVLAKLRWLEQGNRVSERQWRDVLGVIRTQAVFDWEYARRFAVGLGVEDLLDEAEQAASR
jgi:hypothetical protein